MRPIAEQVIVITGASSGIGRATALDAARHGAKVVLAARGAEALETVRQEIDGLGAQAIAVPTDVAVAAEVETLAQTAVERFGRIDTWVNDAAVTIYGEFLEIAPEEFQRVLDTNVMGVVHGCRAALQRMRQQDGGGTIVNIASGLADRSVPLQTAYCASKHAVRGFSEALRVELEHAGIPVRVAVIKPASIDTPFFAHARSKMGVEPRPVPPVYDPSLVAGAILHAATHDVRELSVGGASAAMSTLEKISPRLLDLQLKVVGYPAQQTDQPAHNGDDNLDRGSPGPGAIRGGWNGRRLSAYTWYKLHPRARPALLGGAAVAGLLTVRARRD